MPSSMGFGLTSHVLAGATAPNTSVAKSRSCMARRICYTAWMGRGASSWAQRHRLVLLAFRARLRSSFLGRPSSATSSPTRPERMSRDALVALRLTSAPRPEKTGARAAAGCLAHARALPDFPSQFVKPVASLFRSAAAEGAVATYGIVIKLPNEVQINLICDGSKAVFQTRAENQRRRSQAADPAEAVAEVCDVCTKLSFEPVLAQFVICCEDAQAGASAYRHLACHGFSRVGQRVPFNKRRKS